MSEKRNAKGQFVKGNQSGNAAKGSKAKKAKKAPARSKGSGGIAGRVSRLERGQAALVSVVTDLERRVSEHDRAIARIGSVVGERFAAKKRGKR